MNIQKSPYLLVLLLISAWLLGLAGESFYTPAMPDISNSLQVSATLVKYTISFFVLGKAISMFLCSPFAETFGRRQFILFGLSLFILGSFLSFFSKDIYFLLGGRLMQGLGCSITILMGRAIVNDCFMDSRAANIFSYIFIGNAIGIITLPILGGYAAAYLGWRSTFLILALYGAAIFFCMWWWLPETSPTTSLKNLRLRTILSNYLTIIRNKQFWGFVLCLVFVMAGEKAYTTSAAFLFISTGGLSKVAYGYLTAVISSAHLLGALVCGMLVLKYEVNRTMAIGVMQIAVAAILMLILSSLHIESISLFSVLMFIYMFGTGFIITLSAVGIVRPFPKLIGFSTAFAMCLEFIIAGGVSFMISHHSSAIAPVARTIGILGVFTFFCWAGLIRLRPQIKI